MGLFDFLGNKNKSNALQYRYQYQPQQDALVEQFIEQNFGPIDTRVCDICGNLIKVDLCFISPNANNPSYLLVTKGLGAYLMAMSDFNNPDNNLSRIELVLDSGEPWEIGFGENRDYWAQELIATIVDRIVNQGLSLSTGVLEQSDLNINLKDCAPSFMVSTPDHYEAYQNFASNVAIGNNDKVSFLLLVDNEDEAEAEVHENTMSNEQVNAGNNLVPSNNNQIPFVFDNIDELVRIANEKSIDPINAYNHVAIFVRWALENKLINDSYKSLLQGDVRSYLQNNLKSLPTNQFFTPEGVEFLDYYYAIDDQPRANYVDDVINYVLESVNEDCSEALCLYLSYDEQSYQDLKEIIDKVFEAFHEQVEYNYIQNAELYEVAKGLLNTECIYFPPTNDDIHLASVFSYAYVQNSDQYPIIMELDYNYIKGLINYLCPNTCDANSFDYDPNEAVSSVNQALAEAQSYLGLAPEILTRLMESNLEDLQNNGGSLYELKGDFDSAHNERLNSPDYTKHNAFEFDTYWRGDTEVNSSNNQEEEITKATLLTYLPVDRPYQALAYLPFVPTNCGMTLPEMMAVVAYFEERYEANLAVVSVDTIEFVVDRKLSQEEAMQAAQDLYAFTPYALDMCEVSDPTLAHLASYLMDNQVWTCMFDLNEDTTSQTPHEEEDSSFSF